MRTKWLVCVVCLAACGGGDDEPSETVETCLGGSMQCGDVCVDLDSDQLNCGGCGIACGDTATCAAGTCQPVELPAPTCAAPLAMCGDACVDTDVDPNNCGGCEMACGLGEACTAGTCEARGWEFLGSTTGDGAEGEGAFMMLTDYEEAGQTALYAKAGELGTFYRYDFPTATAPQGTFTELAPIPAEVGTYSGLARIGDSVYLPDQATLFRYDIAGEMWTTELDATLEHVLSDAAVAHDDAGHLYAWASDQYLVTIDTTNDYAVTYTVGPDDLTTTEPRAAWDADSARLFLADYEGTALYAYNPADGMFTARAEFPGLDGFGDAFCSDRHGHIYAGTSEESYNLGDVWEYTIATDTWRQLTLWLPFSQSYSTSCSVSADGYLYWSNGDEDLLARLKL